MPSGVSTAAPPRRPATFRSIWRPLWRPNSHL
ncbi:hypothetical protein GGP99_000403 [Salinibacter ruber]|uniref:Uncharacterized protein n=1 Tax=Salinibacter ruber TaxID=146919 RepID=A0AAW5P5C9_9BACT|nr:hypothetical protein [Salinibacter ruber]MCS4221798.1 hypothetical protein [Salinibacter ruber]